MDYHYSHHKPKYQTIKDFWEKRERDIMTTTPDWIMIGGDGPESYNQQSSYQVQI